MCGGSKNVTSTTNTEPPAYLAGPLQTAANAAVGDFNRSRYGGTYRQQYGGVQPSPLGHPVGSSLNGGSTLNGEPFEGRLSDLFPDSVRNAFARNDGLNPFSRDSLNPFLPSARQDLIGQSRALTSNSLSGAFLHPESNPYLASTFNRAADLTRTRLDSEFAGAGRNLGASMPARSEELQTLASNLFGQNYQAERDRQLASQGQAQELDPINLLINRLAGITPGAGGKTTATQPIIRTGIF